MHDSIKISEEQKREVITAPWRHQQPVRWRFLNISERIWFYLNNDFKLFRKSRTIPLRKTARRAKYLLNLFRSVFIAFLFESQRDTPELVSLANVYLSSSWNVLLKRLNRFCLVFFWIFIRHKKRAKKFVSDIFSFSVAKLKKLFITSYRDKLNTAPKIAIPLTSNKQLTCCKIDDEWVIEREKLFEIQLK